MQETRSVQPTLHPEANPRGGDTSQVNANSHRALPAAHERLPFFERQEVVCRPRHSRCPGGPPGTLHWEGRCRGLRGTLTDSAIRATADTVRPNRSSPFRYAGKSCSISDFFLTHATGSKILSQTPTYGQKKVFMTDLLLAK